MPRPPRTAAVAVIAVATACRLVWAAVFPATTDDAYHWQFAVHPALSYFDHPPMTMLVEQVGLGLFGGWVHPFSLRFGFVLLAAGTSWALYRWAADVFDPPTGVWAVFGFSVSHYLTAISSVCAVTDGPFFFFAVLTGWLVTRAVQRSRHTECADSEIGTRSVPTTLQWALVGVALGGAMLSKYQAVLLPAGVVVYALLTPGARRLLWSPGPYLAVAVAGVLFSPVIYWNATHEWASFGFQGGRIATETVSPLAHGGPLVWLLGPLTFLMPWMWFWLSAELARRLWRFGEQAGPERLLVCMAGTTLGFFLVNSFLSGGTLPHWPLSGFLPLFPLAGARWAGIHRRRPGWAKAMAVSWAAAEVALLAGTWIHLYTGRPDLGPAVDRGTEHCSGWDSVLTELDERGILNEPGVFLATNRWEDAAQLAFAVRNRVQVTCYHSSDARGFAFWSNPADYVGRTGYLLTLSDRGDPADTTKWYAPFFARMTLVAEFPMTRGGVPFRPVRLFRCERQHTPYPFDFTRRK